MRRRGNLRNMIIYANGFSVIFCYNIDVKVIYTNIDWRWLMINLRLLLSECIKEIQQLNIPIGTIIEIRTRKFNNKFGLCEEDDDGCFHITIDERMVLRNIDIKDIKTTIIHEILHTCDDCIEHNEQWIAYAKKIETAYGYGYELMRIHDNDDIFHKEKPIQHKVECPYCHSFGYIRNEKKWNRWMSKGGIICPYCHTLYDTIY